MIMTFEFSFEMVSKQVFISETDLFILCLFRQDTIPDGRCFQKFNFL